MYAGYAHSGTAYLDPGGITKGEYMYGHYNMGEVMLLYCQLCLENFIAGDDNTAHQELYQVQKEDREKDHLIYFLLR